jgi:hypothetical protein
MPILKTIPSSSKKIENNVVPFSGNGIQQLVVVTLHLPQYKEVQITEDNSLTYTVLLNYQ